MKYLIDASSLLLLIKNKDIKDILDYLQESVILDLTFYEIGNAIWKESTLTRLITLQEAEKLGTVAQTMLASINRVTIGTEIFQQILRIAQTEKLSYYDSSYIYVAKERSLILITEDKELRTKGQNYVSTKNVAALASSGHNSVKT